MEDIVIKPLTGEDLYDISILSGEVFLPEYNVTKVNLKDKLIDDEDRFEEGSFVIRERNTGRLIGFIGTKISHSSLYPNTAWISIIAVAGAYRRRGYGRLLINEAVKSLKKTGVKNLSIGQEFHNFFSGIPNPNEENLAFFNSLKFSINEGSHYDLEAYITDNYKLMQFDTSKFTTEFEVRTYNGEYDGLMKFLNSEFPGRWVYEADTALKKGKDPSEILLLWNKEEKRACGFCMLTSYKDEKGCKTGYGGLGPIGIASSIRGRHIGDYLLRESLIQAGLNGINRVNIDWTILVKFYGQFGFLIKRTYRAAYKELL